MKMFKRIWHGFFGHPKDQITWGSPTEGATCKGCGAHWTHADLVV